MTIQQLIDILLMMLIILAIVIIAMMMLTSVAYQVFSIFLMPKKMLEKIKKKYSDARTEYKEVTLQVIDKQKERQLETNQIIELSRERRELEAEREEFKLLALEEQKDLQAKIDELRNELALLAAVKAEATAEPENESS